MVDAFDRGAAAGKGVPFEDVVPDDRERRNAAQPVEQVVVGFRVGKGGGVHFRFFVLGSFWDVLLQRYDSRSKGKSVCGVFFCLFCKELSLNGPWVRRKHSGASEGLNRSSVGRRIRVFRCTVCPSVISLFCCCLLSRASFLRKNSPLLLQESIKISYF